MIEGGDAEKIVMVGLVVMPVFDHAGSFEVTMGQENWLGGSGGAGCKIKRCIV
jgi:hypothetical protein